MDIVNCSVDSFEYSPSDIHPDQRELSDLSKNKILSVIRSTTGSPIEDIQGKSQLTYLFDYLASKHVGARTVVAEQEYVDKHYLEDYAEYYSRCFSNHKRKCARLHFFSFGFDEGEFLDSLESHSTEFHAKLQKHYLGFCVIRPLAKTFLGKICITPYEHLLDNEPNQHRLIKRKEKVSLFGIPLVVNTASMREQDKVVSACATSAIWSLLNANAHLSKDQMPSLSAITRVAAQIHPEQDRIFPNIGLSPDSTNACLNHYGLEPLSVRLTEDTDLDTVKKWLLAYLNADIPVLIGGEIYRQSLTDGEFELLGKHFVCALGYEIGNSSTPNSKQEEPSLKFLASRLTKAFVHDDRYGQYTSMRFDNPELIKTNSDAKETNSQMFGFKLSRYQGLKEVIVPNLLIIGLYHKIRLNYLDISEVAEVFSAFVYAFYQQVREEKTFGDRSEDILTALKDYMEGEVTISLTDNSSLKQELEKHAGWNSSSFGPKKSDTLIKSLPRYMWQLRVTSIQGEKITDLLFDATEILQGDIFIGYISYSVEAESFWVVAAEFVSDELWDKLSEQLVETAKASGDIFDPSPASSIKKYFTNSDNTYTRLFGICRPPRRNLNKSELTDHQQVVKQHPVIVIGDTEVENWPTLDKEVQYIWVVDSFGQLVLGYDINEPDEESGYPRKEGHPTLVNYEPARVGGELFYSLEQSEWIINTRSGTYSRHLRDTSDQEDLLQNVIQLRFRHFNQGIVSPFTKRYQDEV